MFCALWLIFCTFFLSSTSGANATTNPVTYLRPKNFNGSPFNPYITSQGWQLQIKWQSDHEVLGVKQGKKTRGSYYLHCYKREHADGRPTENMAFVTWASAKILLEIGVTACSDKLNEYVILKEPKDGYHRVEAITNDCAIYEKAINGDGIKQSKCKSMFRLKPNTWKLQWQIGKGQTNNMIF